MTDRSQHWISQQLIKAGPGLTWYVIKTRRGLHFLSPNKVDLRSNPNPNLEDLFNELYKFLRLDSDHWSVGIRRDPQYNVLRVGQKYPEPDLKFWFKVEGTGPYDPMMNRLIQAIYGISEESIQENPLKDLYQKLSLVIDNRIYQDYEEQ